MKIVINKCFGGFGLSESAYKELGMKWDGYGFNFSDDRTNPALVSCVENLGPIASGKLADLKVVEIPDDVKWQIEDDNGVEIVREISRFWE